jgi:hypothetical protein
MDRETVIRNIAISIEGILAIAMQILREEELIAELKRNGRDVTQEMQLLEQLRQMQARRETERDHLIEIAAEIRPDVPSRGSTQAARASRPVLQVVASPEA